LSLPDEFPSGFEHPVKVSALPAIRLAMPNAARVFFNFSRSIMYLSSFGIHALQAGDKVPLKLSCYLIILNEKGQKIKS
jgi:hypothetical protein